MEIIDKEIYKKITELAVHDKFEVVRIHALKLVWVMSSIPHSSSVGYEQVVDEGFKRMSTGVVDGSIHVRYLASTLLGSFHNVSSQCVLQTFSKEILAGQYKGALSLSRSKQTAEQYSTNSNTPSIVDNQTYIDTKNEIDHVDYIIVAEEDSSVLDVEKSSTAAVGIFISALEDEFFLVRSAALDSICELSILQSGFTTHPNDSSRKSQSNLLFAARAVDFLVGKIF